MDEFGCDYSCKTVGESITKYNISNDWCAEFDAYDDVYPIVCIQVEQIRKSSKMMALELRVVEDADHELAGCTVCAKQKTVAFKIDRMNALTRAMQTE